jgi:hypothetical protein
VIRFSAALVAVAIGVLIGGVTTSKLLLVYIAIVVSAVALVALAIGVVLKREELFGEGQGLVPAAAGIGPVQAAHVGAGQGKAQAGAPVAPPPPFPEAAGGRAAAFGGTVAPAAAAPALAADPVAARPATAGPGRADGPVPPWETPAARGPWTVPAPDWLPAGRDEQTVGAGDPAPSAWQDTTRQDTTPRGRAGGWSSSGPDAQDTKAPRSWAAPPPPAVTDAPPAGPSAGSGAAAPSWFDRLGGQAGADAPAAPATAAQPAPIDWRPWAGQADNGPAAGEDQKDAAASVASGGNVSTAPESSHPSAGDEDDDWPTRYSWLDDGNDGGQAEPGPDGTAEAGAERESDPAAPAAVASAAESAAAATLAAPTVAAPTVAAPPVPGSPAAGSARDRSALDREAAGADEVGLNGHVGPDGNVSPGDADEGDDPGADVIAFPRPSEQAGAGQDDPGQHDDRDDPGADATMSEASAPSAAEPEAPDAAEADAALVTVVPGVPRYHRPDCVLIRFMPDGDVRKQPTAQAKESGCTPCAACQPEG